MCRSIAIGSFALLAAGLLGAAAAAQEPEFTQDFRLAACHWSSSGGNPFFPLERGRFNVLEGESDGEELRVEIRVLSARREIELEVDGEEIEVPARVVEEREWEGGELVEVSRNFLARCRETNDVFYFGEEVDYEDGEIVSHDGAWRAGEGGALPGLIMPGTFLLGSRYFQEIAPGVALDRAERVAMGLEIETEAGVFEGCVEIEDSSALDPSAGDQKLYCPGVGLVVDEDVELVEFGRGREHDRD
jgi:hypothetical protein